jgi:translation initiation factor IF-1
MAKEETLSIDGIIKEVLPGGMFKVDVNGNIVLAYSSGKMKKNKISIAMGDHVTLEISPYDLTRGRISYRHR